MIILDSDLQDPPAAIPELVARWRDGAEVVYAERRRPGETRIKLLTAAAFYRVIARITATNQQQSRHIAIMKAFPSPGATASPSHAKPRCPHVIGSKCRQ